MRPLLYMPGINSVENDTNKVSRSPIMAWVVGTIRREPTRKESAESFLGATCTTYCVCDPESGL